MRCAEALCADHAVVAVSVAVITLLWLVVSPHLLARERPCFALGPFLMARAALLSAILACEDWVRL